MYISNKLCHRTDASFAGLQPCFGEHISDVGFIRNYATLDNLRFRQNKLAVRMQIVIFSGTIQNSICLICI